MTDEPSMTTLAPWYGGCRKMAEGIGHQLGKLEWCGVPFAGGMPELYRIKTRSGVANDLHRHIINLARVVRDPAAAAEMGGIVESLIFHPEEFKDAQRRCVEREKAWEQPTGGGLFGAETTRPECNGDVQWAADYFVNCWMGRGGSSGQQWEFQQEIAMRWTASGGGSAVRWRSAVNSLKAWTKILARWEFTTLDAFEFIGNISDLGGHGIYADAPWPGAGEQYRYRFTTKDQMRLAKALGSFRQTRVVIRFGDDPLIRSLYPQPKWTWIEQTSRNQSNKTIPEVLILNGPVYPEAA